MNKTIIAIAISLGVIYSACKKKDNTAPDNSNITTGITTTTGSTTGGVIMYSGYFPLTETNYWSNGVNVSNSPKDYSTFTKLFPAPVEELYLGIGTSANLGSVFLNGTKMYYYASPVNSYIDSTSMLDLSSQRTVILNSTSLPSFTVNVTENFVQYDSFNASYINDTLHLNTKFTVPLVNITNYDKVDCSISLRNPLTSADYMKSASKSFTTITSGLIFSINDLSVFSTGQELKVKLTLYKIRNETIGGKVFRFEVKSVNQFDLVAD